MSGGGKHPQAPSKCFLQADESFRAWTGPRAFTFELGAPNPLTVMCRICGLVGGLRTMEFSDFPETVENGKIIPTDFHSLHHSSEGRA